MKKIIYILFMIVITGWTSCEKFPDNGDLDGQWQLIETSFKETPSDPEYAITKSKKDDHIYWAFHQRLLMIRSSDTPLNGYTHDTSARFIHKDNKMDITETYIHWRGIGKDSLLTDPNTRTLSDIGIDGNAEKFDVEKLNSKSMILTTPVKRLVFRKF